MIALKLFHMFIYATNRIHKHNILIVSDSPESAFITSKDTINTIFTCADVSW
jgi:hypothetical protein